MSLRSVVWGKVHWSLCFKIKLSFLFSGSSRSALSWPNNMLSWRSWTTGLRSVLPRHVSLGQTTEIPGGLLGGSEAASYSLYTREIAERHRYCHHAPAGPSPQCGQSWGQLSRHPHPSCPSSGAWTRRVGRPDGKCQLPLPDAASTLEVVRDSSGSRPTSGSPAHPLPHLSLSFLSSPKTEDQRPDRRLQLSRDCLTRSQGCGSSVLMSMSL